MGVQADPLPKHAAATKDRFTTLAPTMLCDATSETGA